MSFMGDFSREEQRLIKACLNIGPLIPELLYLLDTSAKSSKIRSYRPDSIESQSLNFLNSLSWLPAQKKNYQFSLDGIGANYRNGPSFSGAMPTNQWTFIFQEISNRLGLSSWNWKLSRLHEQIEGIIPRMVNRNDLIKSSSKISRWMRGLSAEQHGAWTDIAKLSRELDDASAAFTMYRFIIRLTTLVCVNHSEALRSLYAMKVPVFLIWDYENWLLGPQYSSYRTALNLNSKVSVPRSLRTLDLL
jgi:hypothetical protein